MLHLLNIFWIGRYLGIPGSLLILFSFVYSLRKRQIINTGSPKKLLQLHEYMAWVGSILILVHAGIHYNAHLGWLATYVMIINVASGLTGKFIIKNARESLSERRVELISSGLSVEEVEKKLFYDTITFGLINKWRVIHLPIALMFFILSFLHIITILIFT